MTRVPPNPDPRLRCALCTAPATVGRLCESCDELQHELYQRTHAGEDMTVVIREQIARQVTIRVTVPVLVEPERMARHLDSGGKREDLTRQRVYLTRARCDRWLRDAGLSASSQLVGWRRALEAKAARMKLDGYAARCHCCDELLEDVGRSLNAPDLCQPCADAFRATRLGRRVA